jgi:hypothetical protein
MLHAEAREPRTLRAASEENKGMRFRSLEDLVTFKNVPLTCNPWFSPHRAWVELVPFSDEFG